MRLDSRRDNCHENKETNITVAKKTNTAAKSFDVRLLVTVKGGRIENHVDSVDRTTHLGLISIAAPALRHTCLRTEWGITPLDYCTRVVGSEAGATTLSLSPVSG